MAIDFETIKKIDAKGVNVGMIQDSAGNILWRKKYKECSLGLGTDGSEGIFAWRPYFSSAFSALLNNDYFHYGDRVDLFQSLDGTKNAVVSWYDGSNVSVPERYVSFLKTADVIYDAKTTVVALFSRNITAQGLLTQYGKIENQTRINNYDGYATDDKACLVADTIANDFAVAPSATAWNTLMPKFGPQATFYNRYYDFGAASSSASTTDMLIVKVSRTNYDGQTSTYTYKLTITANCKTLPAVAFSYKTSDSTSATNVTLTDNSSSSFTIKGNKVLNFYRQSCYVNSNGSVIGTNTSPFLKVDLNASATYRVPLTAVYPSKSSTNYGFLMDSSGNITNSNKKVASSLCYCTMKFQRPSERFTKLRITYTQSSEVNYDYGQFSKIDKMLCAYHTADAASTGFGASLQHSCKGEDSSVHTITYNISSLKVGTDHFINFKYHKDNSNDGGTDTFQISKIEFLEDCEYSFGYDDDLQTYGLSVYNSGTAAVNFKWLWFYIAGSSEDYTSGGISQSNLAAIIPPGGSTTMWLTDFVIPQQSGMKAGLFECNGALHLFIQ